MNVAERVKTKESGPRAALFKTLRVLQMVLLGLPEAFDLVFSKLQTEVLEGTCGWNAVFIPFEVLVVGVLHLLHFLGCDHLSLLWPLGKFLCEKPLWQNIVLAADSLSDVEATLQGDDALACLSIIISRHVPSAKGIEHLGEDLRCIFAPGITANKGAHDQ